MLDAPVLTALAGGEREKRRAVALSAIPERMREAVRCGWQVTSSHVKRSVR